MTDSVPIHELREWADELGMAGLGVARAGPMGRRDYLEAWLANGRAGEMTYLARHHDLRCDPRGLLRGARSVIVVADSYHQPGGQRVGVVPGQQKPVGRVARYAWGRDYHRVLRKKLHRLADRLHATVDRPFETRVCVDTAPIVEREVAAAAGIGWIGKNTMVLSHELGSFFFLGEIVTTLDLPPTPPIADHCGHCSKCLDACPTGALTAPYQMDARKCIAYLTIEHRSDIDADLRPQMENWVFGCDICQDVCPHNSRNPVPCEPAYELRDRFLIPPYPGLDEMINMTDEAYRQKLEGSAMERATPDMLRRNARIARNNTQRT